jgi:hypothetical protein
MTALTSRQRELLAAVSERVLVWDRGRLVDERRDPGEVLPESDVSCFYDLEWAGLVQPGAVRPYLTAGGLLLAQRRRPVSPWVALAGAAVVGLAVWGALAVVLVVTGWLW